MIKIDKYKFFLTFNLIFIFALFSLSSSIVIGQDNSFSEVQQKMDEISDEEKEVLQKLFLLSQEIEAIEIEENSINNEIEIINSEVNKIKKKIIVEALAYEEKLEILKQVLKSYQRKGPGTFLETILSSENLTMLLRRLNTLRDFTRETGELLKLLDKSKENMSLQKTKLDEKLASIKDKQIQLKVSLDNKIKFKNDIEAYLASLDEERERYQQNLTNVQQAWDRLKPLYSNITKAIYSIIEEGNLPEDAIEISFSILGVKGSIDEKTFNDIISENPDLPKMTFGFESERMVMQLPEEKLVLSGKFIALENNILKFEAEEGSFYGMLLDSISLDELFQENSLTINLQPLLGDNTLSSVEVKEGKLELTIIPNLF